MATKICIIFAIQRKKIRYISQQKKNVIKSKLNEKNQKKMYSLKTKFVKNILDFCVQSDLP